MGDIDIKFPSLEEALDEYFLGPPGARPQLNLFPDVTKKFEDYLKKSKLPVRLTRLPNASLFPVHAFPLEVKTVSVTMNVFWEIAQRTPQHLAKALESPAVRKVIFDALNEQLKRTAARSVRTRASGELDKEVAKKFIGNLRSTVFDNFKSELKNDPGVLQLKNRLEQVKNDFLNHTAVGVWVNENMTLITITAAVLAVGGGALLYHLKPGDKPFSKGVNKVSQFADFEFSPIGTLKIGAKIDQFIPRDRTVGATVTAKGKWQYLPTNLKVSGAIVGDKAQKLESDLTVWITPEIPVYIVGGAKLQRGGPKVSPFGYRIGLGLKTSSNGFSIDIVGSVSSDRFLDQFNLKGSLNYANLFGDSANFLQLYGNYSRPIRGRGREKFSLGFNFVLRF
ncbi:MAG TPA: hypothetical protein ENJ62_07435, partial [Bryobacterales bacterium]|nr:hypothetical protein [Bryobacterales bacterium]